MAFCHLHVHSEYSLLDGANRIDDMVERAKTLGHPALALTDHGNLLGAFDFYKAAVEAGIRPVIGCEVYVALGSRLVKEKSTGAKRAWHLLLLARNQTGYRNLMALVSRGYLEGFYYNPRVDRELLQQYAEGLICCSACLSGEVPVQILEEKMDAAARTLREYQSIFGEDNVYLEVMANGLPAQQIVNEGLAQLSRDLSLPLVATTDCHYLTESHYAMQDVMLAIQTQRKLAETDRFRMEINQFWLKTEEEMRDQLPAFGEAIERTVEVAERCEVDLLRRDKEYYTPAFELPAEKRGMSEVDFLKELVWEGIAARYAEVTDEIRERVEYELSVIFKMGYASYFLIVWDFIRFAREAGISVGPGRGSAAGSIVAYALRIVDIDPLRHGLLFERFLNPDRISMPDIDIDFDDRRRHEVIEYVTRRYGRECVSQIATIGRIKAKNAIRDVGRVLDIPLADVNRIAAMIPDGPKVTLSAALKEDEDLRALARRTPAMRDLFRFAMQLEGIGRQVGVHAAGVVIGDRPLMELVPLLKTAQDEVATQFTMEALEELGLLKMDFLGLKNLSIIDDTLAALAGRGIAVDWNALDFKDDAAYALLRCGQTDGVFQVESDGMKRLLRDLKPTCFDDIAAVLALYRPGPLNSGYTQTYVDAKNGKVPVRYADPRLEPILRDTYGVIAYQEQVMRIAHELAGFSLAEADTLRKAMGKKKPEVMARMREQFVSGCVARKMRQRAAAELFTDIEKFAEYCFNKSHTAAYAVLTFRTAYLKANYPKEFMAALLSSQMHDTAGLLKYIRDAESMGLPILPPDINQSGSGFTPVELGIRYGLAGIKGVGEGLVRKIIEERDAGGVYSSVEDFCRRLSGNLLNAKVVECLVRAGAFDSFGLRRAQLLDLFPRAIDVAVTEQRNREDYGGGLFAAVVDETEPIRLSVADMPEIDAETLLQHERQLLGIYISGHPADAVRDDIDLVRTHGFDELAAARHRAPVTVGGVLTDLKRRKFSSGESRGDALLEDGKGFCELIIPQEVLEQTEHFLENFALVVVSGTLERREDVPRVRAKAIYPVSEVRTRVIRAIGVTLRAEDVSPAGLDKVAEAVRRHPGQAKLYFYVAVPGAGTYVVRAGEPYTVTPTPELIRALRTLLSPVEIKFDTENGASLTPRQGEPAARPEIEATDPVVVADTDNEFHLLQQLEA